MKAKGTIIVLVGLMLVPLVTYGWWDHPYITRCAWDVQPAELVAPYTAFERDELCYHAMMSDYPRMKTAGDFGYFQLWDAFMWKSRRKVADYANGGGQDIDFAHVLRAMRTETSLNAFLAAGALLHAVEDKMSVSHNGMEGPYQSNWHGICEMLVDWPNFNIAGYRPKRLLPTDDPAALTKECERRIAAVNAKAKAAWPQIKAIIDEHGIRQPKEQALQTTRRFAPHIVAFARDATELMADMLFTFLSVRRASATNAGAQLVGTVGVPDDPLNARRSAKVWLQTAAGRPTDYETLAIGGAYAFRNLPEGTYRLAVTRLGAKIAVTEPFVLRKGATTRTDAHLESDLPLGNQVWNPTAAWDLYGAGSPDRWRIKPLFNWGPLQQPYWRTSFMHVEPGWVYRCGAKLKKPGTAVRFRFSRGWGGHGPAVELDFKGGCEAELLWTNLASRAACFAKAKIEIVATEPVTNLIEKVWFVPIPPKTWTHTYPLTDYVTDDNTFRRNLHCEPPQPEFWQRDMAKDPPTAGGVRKGGAASRMNGKDH